MIHRLDVIVLVNLLIFTKAREGQQCRGTLALPVNDSCRGFWFGNDLVFGDPEAGEEPRVIQARPPLVHDRRDHPKHEIPDETGNQDVTCSPAIKTINSSPVSKMDVGKQEIPNQIIAALERLGPTTIKRLAKETRHGYKTIITHLEQLRKAGRVIATIPEDLPANRISPGRAVWILIPPDKTGNEQRGDGSISFDGEWEPL